ncbi:MAG: class I SAM-dependent methyltransferase [Candidatus Bathyarchaeota archaeon]
MEADEVKKLVKKHYSEYGIGEWERLTKHPYNRLEFDTTMYFLRQNLPNKGLVLDAGGGPGRYAIELAKMGYDVMLLDLTPKLLKIAQEQILKAKIGEKVREVLQGSIDDLSMFDDNTFDVVTCLGGALSHLVSGKRREKAASELIRVAKPDAPIFVSVIGKLATCMNTIVFLWPELKSAPEVWRKYIATGDYFGGTGFAPTHFYTPEELEREFEGKAKILKMIGLEGMFSTHEKEYNEVYEMEIYNDILWETHLKTCTHPSIIGISEHFMMICTKNR